jgi:hypothetical protein
VSLPTFPSYYRGLTLLDLCAWAWAAVDVLPDDRLHRLLQALQAYRLTGYRLQATGYRSEAGPSPAATAASASAGCLSF